MESFFALTYKNNPFVSFSIVHIMALLFFFFSVICLFCFRKTFQQEKWNRIVRYFFVATTLAFEVTYHTWLLITHKWRLSYHLPLELCTFSLLLCIILLLTKNQKVFEIVYFTGLTGATLALLTPELHYNFPHFRYFHFFYNHTVIVLTCLFFVWVEGYRVTFRSVLKTMGWLTLAIFVISTINKWVDGNYMFLAHKPDNPTPIDFLGPYPWYIVSMEVVAFCLFVCLWLPFSKKKKK